MQIDSFDDPAPITSRDGFRSSQPIQLVAADRTVLGGTLFRPGAGAGATGIPTVIVHGATATPQSYYRRFAEFLAASGLRVLTYDYRGIGRSRPDVLRGYRATMTDWAKVDAAAAHAYVREHFDPSPVVVVGHSFGGQLFGLLDDVQDARGAVLVGSQLGYYGSWPLMTRLTLGLVWRAVPSFTALWGYLPGKVGIGEDLPRGVAEEWARWCSHPEYLMGEHEDARARFARFVRPVRLYSFTDDDFAPERAVRHLVSCLRSTEVERVVVAPREHGGQPIGHFGFFRPRFRDTLWAETAQYVKDVAADRTPRPPASGRRAPSADAWKPFAGFSIDASDLGCE